jgi:succinyl-CoA synthetase beta subunit
LGDNEKAEITRLREEEIMPRKKLSEYRSKQMVSTAIGLPYVGWSITSIADLVGIETCTSYVIKVDQAVKGRFKKGLVKLDVSQKALKPTVSVFLEEGYTSLIVEPFLKTDASERYLSIQRTRGAVVLLASAQGGVDIESNQAGIVTYDVSTTPDWVAISKATKLNEATIKKLITLFDNAYISFLEINPYVVEDDVAHLLDVAIEVDGAATLQTNIWDDLDIRNPKKEVSAQEQAVAELDDHSSASFNLSVLNSQGSIALLLSGGGASVVVADEIYQAGRGNEIINYGEYSGSPTEDETYQYAKQVVAVLLNSGAENKRLFIGGAIANFTDIQVTFKGIIRALREKSDELAVEQVKVFVRRGGPNQTKGLSMMETALSEIGILGNVYGPEVSIGDAVKELLK